MDKKRKNMSKDYIEEAKDILLEYSKVNYNYFNKINDATYDHVKVHWDKLVNLIAAGLENQDEKSTN